MENSNKNRKKFSGMQWANFLHFYQPYNQQADILERIVNESYRKVISGLALNSQAKITININAGLTELLIEKGYRDVIEQIKEFAQKGQIQFTGGVKFHPFLPLLPEKEIIRQIQLNEETNKKYFGSAWQPQGFFSPELAYSKKVGRVAQKAGFKWIIAEELARPGKNDFTKIYSIKGLDDFKVVLRDKRISVLILSAVVRSFKSLIQEIGEEEINKDRYLLTVMDVETFGHHRPGLEDFLYQIYTNKKIPQVFISDLVEKFGVIEKTELRDSTWSSEEQDFWLEKEKKHSFTLWSHPANPIHQLQWEFTNFVIKLVNNLDQHKKWYQEIREKLDRALQSDQFWWASAKPWWSLEMIEQGAYNLRDVVFSIPNVSKKDKQKALDYYRQIIDLAFDWQRSGKIRQAYRQSLDTIKKRPYQKRVLAGQFNSMILEFEDEMNKAIKLREFEKAIKWRDAIAKLKNGTDIYDVMHVVDDLRQTRHLPSLKDYWEHSPEEFSDFAKNNFIDFKEEKFLKKQPNQLWQEVKDAFLKKKMGHPLGFFRDKYDNIYFCEVPSKYIEHWPGEMGWDAMSIMKFPQKGSYSHSGQCFYEVKKDKIRIIVKPQSLTNNVLKLVRDNDINKGQEIRLAVLTENQNWSPIFFKKDKNNNLFAEIPYHRSPQGQGFKFKILGLQPKSVTSN